MRKTKTTFLFRRMMLIVFAFLGYAAMTQAQVYVVDDFVNDSTPCFEYQLKEGKYLLPDDEPMLYLHNGDTINVFEMKHIITAKRKACGIKNEMRFSDGKTKCAIKKHPSNETWMLFC